MTTPERQLREALQKVTTIAKATAEASNVSRETVAAQSVTRVEIGQEVSDSGSRSPSNTP